MKSLLQNTWFYVVAALLLAGVSILGAGLHNDYVVVWGFAGCVCGFIDAFRCMRMNDGAK